MKTTFVLFDSLCRNAMGCYGSRWVKTPNFDRFARRGVTFDSHFVGSLPCMKVVLPLAVPGLIAAGILAFIFSWNEFPIALSLTSRETATVPVAIARFAQQYEVQHAQMAAASVISTIPAILLMFLGQRFIIRGLTLGSVK